MINKTLIENYFSNNLEENEKKEFEIEYQTNPEFKDEVDFLNNIKKVTEKEDTNQFKEKLVSFENQYSKKTENRYVSWIKPVAAIAAIFIIAIAINFFFQTKESEQKLFLTYFEPSKNVSAPIVRATKNENIENNAFISYSEYDYVKALSLFEEAYSESKNSELLFYEGNALLALGKTKEAINKLKQHLQTSDSLSNRTHWYLALAYLKNKEPNHAKEELKQLLASGEPFKNKEATLLLEKLD